MMIGGEQRGHERASGTEWQPDYEAQGTKSPHKSVRNEVRPASLEVREMEVKIIRGYFIN